MSQFWAQGVCLGFMRGSWLLGFYMDVNLCLHT